MSLGTFTTDWRRFPHGTRAAGHVFAIGDIHGRADLLEALLNHVAAIPTEAGRRRKLIFLGDYIDRGPENLTVLRMAMDHGDVLLPGNHEAMLIEGLRQPDPRQMFRLWFNNGGASVVEELDPDLAMSRGEHRRRVIAALPEGFRERMIRAPSHHKDGDLLFVHAGLNPLIERRKFLDQGLCTVGQHHELHWAWIREPFLSWRKGWDGRDDALTPGPTVVVHGHTPCIRVPFRSQIHAQSVIDRTLEHQRINLDVGAPYTNQLAALEAAGDRFRLHVVQVR